MFDIAPTELMVIAIIALVVIGPKDLPRVMRVVGKWVGRARGVARHFREGLDEIVRQSELEEMEQKWRAENERIMREHPASAMIEGDVRHDDQAQAMLPAAEPAYPPHPSTASIGDHVPEPLPGEVVLPAQPAEPVPVAVDISPNSDAAPSAPAIPGGAKG